MHPILGSTTATKRNQISRAFRPHCFRPSRQPQKFRAITSQWDVRTALPIGICNPAQECSSPSFPTSVIIPNEPASQKSRFIDRATLASSRSHHSRASFLCLIQLPRIFALYPSSHNGRVFQAPVQPVATPPEQLPEPASRNPEPVGRKNSSA